MSMVGFPLLLIPLAVYNIIVFVMPGVSFAEPLLKLALMSGAEWTVTLSDVLLALGILLLLFEVIKGARPGAKYLTDHLLSLTLFGAAAAEFVLWPKFGNSTYFLLTALSLADFLSGITLRTRRGAAIAANSVIPKRDTPIMNVGQAELQFDPAPAQAPDPEPVATSAPAAAPVQSAASVAESVLLDHPVPSPAPPAGTPGVGSPEVLSPGLQPGNGSAASPEAPPHTDGRP